MPASVTVNYGEYLNFGPSVSGAQPITFQWLKDGIAIPWANSSTFSKGGNTTPADSGQYTLTATNTVGTTTSAAIGVTVKPAVAPTIGDLPATLTIYTGGSINLSALVTGTQPMTFRWKKNGQIVSISNSSDYYKGGVTTASSGQYTLVVTNVEGTVTSTTVTVTVSPPVAPTISNLPVTLSLAYGESFFVSPTISGTQPITFQWKKDGVAIPGATSYSYNKP